MNLSALVIASVCVTTVFAQSSSGTAAFRMALKLVDECSKSDFKVCLKKKTITFLDRLGRMEKLPLMDGFTLVKSNANETNSTLITENDIDQSIGRSLDDKDAVLNKMILEKAANILDSRTMQIFIPKVSEDVGEGRSDTHWTTEHDHHWTTEHYWVETRRRTTTRRPRRRSTVTHIIHSMMVTAAAASSALLPIAIGLVGLIAAKAFIIAKIALVIAIIIAVRKYLDAQKAKEKPEHTTTHSDWHDWVPGPSSSDRRSIKAQLSAYKGYKQYQ